MATAARNEASANRSHHQSSRGIQQKSSKQSQQNKPALLPADIAVIGSPEQGAEDVGLIGEPAIAAAKTVQQRAAFLLAQELDFVPNPLFTKRNSARKFAEEQVDIPSEVAPSGRGEEKVPTHLTKLCGTPLLTPEQEATLFRRMNFYKFRFNQLRARLNPERPDVALLEEAEQALAIALEVRDLVIRANLRLVVSVARKFVTQQLLFDELFSDGTVALMNAVEKFDFDRGYRFSTYAYYSISRSLYRFIKLSRKNRLQSDLLEQTVESEDSSSFGGWNQERWDFVSGELDTMLEQLDRRERWIIRQRYAFDGQGKSPTYKVLAEKLGICNERVRQLEKRALNKLRSLSEDGRFADVMDSLEI